MNKTFTVNWYSNENGKVLEEFRDFKSHKDAELYIHSCYQAAADSEKEELLEDQDFGIYRYPVILSS